MYIKLIITMWCFYNIRFLGKVGISFPCVMRIIEKGVPVGTHIAFSFNFEKNSRMVYNKI
jgi:hypothetical protein